MNARSIYLLCLRSYPAAFRERHGAEMLRIFECEWRAARCAGWRATLTYAFHVSSDLARTMPHECLAAMTHTGWLAFVTAAICGITATWALFIGHLFYPTAVLLFASTLFFSYFARIRTWRWPVTAAAWLPAFCLFRYFTDENTRERIGSYPLLAFLILFGWALSISFAGAGIGVLLRRILRRRLVATESHDR